MILAVDHAFDGNMLKNEEKEEGRRGRERGDGRGRVCACVKRLGVDKSYFNKGYGIEKDRKERQVRYANPLFLLRITDEHVAAFFCFWLLPGRASPLTSVSPAVSPTSLRNILVTLNIGRL